MKLKLKIKAPSSVGNRDEKHYNGTSFLFRHSEKTSGELGVVNKFGEIVINTSRGSHSYNSKAADDPVYSQLSKTLAKIFLQPTKVRFTDSSHKKWRIDLRGENYTTPSGKEKTRYKDYKNILSQITFKYADGSCFVTVMRNRGYYLNGHKMERDVLLSSLSRIIYRSCFNRSAEIFNRYIHAVLTTPPNVRYALENRSPYFFYDEQEDSYLPKKVDVRINTRRISLDKCAIEISENIWGAISVSDLNDFLNYYRLGIETNKNTWVLNSPRKLWRRLFGSDPTDGEYALMIAWLKQNRTEKMVEDRSRQLMLEIEAEDDAISNFKIGKQQAMFVRGKLCDWILTENGKATGPQRVSIYCFHEVPGRERAESHSWPETFLNGKTTGPICVNNSVGNVSIGDQFASRAFTLMNDELAMKHIHTLKNAMPKSARKGEKKHRINTNMFLSRYKSR
jgi:hypothetical protein